MKYIKLLLIFIPISFIEQFMHVNEGLMFITVCLSIIPLAAVIGEATEQIALFTGSKAGGLINATMSNIPELLIGFFSVKAGYNNLVLASMAGSIIGNVLLVLGLSILLGGLKREYQSFDKNASRSNFILLFFAAMSIIIPFALKYAVPLRSDINLRSSLTTVSLCISVILLITYISGLIFSLITHKNIFIKHQEQEEEIELPKWSLPFASGTLISAAICVAIQSEMLVNTVGHIIKSYGLPEVFIGIIIVPILGNMAENVSAIIMAIKNKVELSIEIAVGSSIQIALFVAPVLILVSFIIDNPIIYVYNPFELVAILIAIGLSLYVFQDGKTNWLEGVVLISCYIILSISFLFI